MTSVNFYVGHREPHVCLNIFDYQTALDYTRASSGIYNIPCTLPNLIPDLPRIQQPTLLLWGNRDQTLAPESFPKIEENYFRTLWHRIQFPSADMCRINAILNNSIRM